MSDLYICNSCHRELPASAFGQVTDNNEIVFVRDPLCVDCRAFQHALTSLVADGRIAVRRAEFRAPLPAWAVAEATAGVQAFFATHPEQPGEFVVDLLARFSLLHVDGDDLRQEVPIFLAAHLPKAVG